jgi:hypothetical protein
MRLVVTECHQCKKITGAKHADTIEELENISAFILEKKRLYQKPKILNFDHTDETLRWCNCNEELGKQSA